MEHLHGEEMEGIGIDRHKLEWQQVGAGQVGSKCSKFAE